MPQSVTPTDQELIAQLREGNANAYTQLFDRYQPLLYIYARKVVKDEDDVADILQDVFISLWDKRETLEITGNVLSYLSGAVKFRFFDLLDKKKVRTDYAVSMRKYIEEASPVTDYQLREREMLRLLEQQIGLLPPKLKLIYELSRKANYSNAYIAEKLGVSEKTVQNQLSLAIRQLRLRMGILNSTTLILGAEALAEFMKRL